MRKNLKTISTLALLSVSSLSALAGIEPRAFCDNQKEVVYQNLDMSEYQSLLDENKIKMVSDGITSKELDEFFFEYNKFPLDLRTEMINNFATIHLIKGHSVMEDPTWDANNTTTFDNRTWSEIVGAGGMPYANLEPLRYFNKMVEYCNSPRVNCATKPVLPDINKPARIVVNRIYNEVDEEMTAKMKSFNNQTYYKNTSGSVSVILHEHAHTLDNLYAYKGVSASQEWIDLTHTAEAREYMSVVCKDKGYCLNNDNEAFAELFAYYHACQKSNSHMERNAPALAAFFHGLREIKSRFNPGVEAISGPAAEALAPAVVAPVAVATPVTEVVEAPPIVEPEVVVSTPQPQQSQPQVAPAAAPEVKRSRLDQAGDVISDVADTAKKAFNGLRSRLFGKKKNVENDSVR